MKFLTPAERGKRDKKGLKKMKKMIAIISRNPRKPAETYTHTHTHTHTSKACLEKFSFRAIRNASAFRIVLLCKGVII